MSASADADIPEDAITHPLHSAWTLFHSSSSKNKATSSTAWESHIKEVYTFSTVEDFWRLWNNITPGCELSGADYYIFRQGIKPSWEDPANSHGGAVKINGIPATDKSKVDKLWLWTVLALIGESLDSSDAINGVTLAARRSIFRIAVWTRDAEDAETNKNIATRLKDVLEIPKLTKLVYTRHTAETELFSV